MSCQQASRFITNNNSSNFNLNNHKNNHNILNNNNNCKSINNTIKGSLINKGSAGGGGGGGKVKLQQKQQEDPYVFTESVPTTPPILFNNQKTRTRLNDLPTGTTLSIGKLQQPQQKLPLTETNGKITLNSLKTQASLLSSSPSLSSSSISITTSTITNLCTAASAITPPTFKSNLTQSLTTTSTATTIATTNNNGNNNKKQANVCIVRPQLQQQQPIHYPQHQNYGNSLLSSATYEEDLKSISPPPLYTPPTPSLWQTPLILETTAPTNTGLTSIPSKNGIMGKSSPITTISQTTVTASLKNCITPTVQTTTVGSITTSTSTTTAMAKVAPIIVHSPLAVTTQIPSPQLTSSPTAQMPNQCLPPSKFHNHTLAQHLQKVECLKKSKRSIETGDNLPEQIKSRTSPLKTPASPIKSSTTASLKMVDNCSPIKHSETEDLNEIPVNVIFRMAMVSQTNEKSANNIQFVKPQSEIDNIAQPPKQIPKPPPLIDAATTQQHNQQQQHIKTNLSKKLSIVPASKTVKPSLQQNNTSSIQQQQQQNDATITALNSQPNGNEEEDKNIKTFTQTNSKITKNSTHISTNKLSCKSNSLNAPTTNLHHTNSGDLSYNWPLDCSTTTTKGAVAIVKISQHKIDLDTTHLATVTGLPYCLQQYWFNSYDFCKSSSSSSSDILTLDKSLNRSLAREERIAVYKQQLRRQAMQLLSTRSLQKLPIQVARRRLMCVDRLLRKYQQSEQFKKELPANIKRCCVNGCDAYTLEMASHCQQHIVYNSAQHVFLPCTAKFADNTQCRVPVFDINHDLPLCIEHARKRDAYNRLLYEQRPRKIITNPMAINETNTNSKNNNNNKNMEVVKGKQQQQPLTGVGKGGIIIKTQNYQQKQQNILQQLPTNRNNSNSGKKRPALVNQQARKRKMTTTNGVANVAASNVSFTSNSVDRSYKRVKKTTEKEAITSANTATQMPRLITTNLKRKSSTTSLESIASNSQHSTASSSTSQQQYQRHQSIQQQNQQQNLYATTSTMLGNTSTTTATTSSSLPPPALAPLSGINGSGLLSHGLSQNLFSFGHDNHAEQYQTQQPHPQHIQPLNIPEKQHSYSSVIAPTASTPTELKDFITQFSLLTQKQSQVDKTNDISLLNTNSNSNFTSSGMGSTTSLPTADDFITQDMLSICENSSASSEDTGLGGLSDSELMLGGPEVDIPLGDTHLLEEHDLENVLNSLHEDAFKELFTTVHQDESDEIERAIELADKHLKTLQQTIGSELGDFLDFNDDMLMDNGDFCNSTTANTILDTSALFIGGGAGASENIGVTSGTNTQSVVGGGAVIGTDIRGLVQT